MSGLVEPTREQLFIVIAAGRMCPADEAAMMANQMFKDRVENQTVTASEVLEIVQCQDEIDRDPQAYYKQTDLNPTPLEILYRKKKHDQAISGAKPQEVEKKAADAHDKGKLSEQIPSNATTYEGTGHGTTTHDAAAHSVITMTTKQDALPAGDENWDFVLDDPDWTLL